MAQEKKMVDRRVREFDPDCCTLKQVKDEIERLIKDYGYDAMIKEYEDDYSDHRYLGIYIKELETDKEFNTRLLQEEQYKARQEQRDRETFERLKKQFEQKGK